MVEALTWWVADADDIAAAERLELAGVGIGVEQQEGEDRPGLMVVVALLPDGPAHRSGKVGMINALDGVLCCGDHQSLERGKVVHAVTKFSVESAWISKGPGLRVKASGCSDSDGWRWKTDEAAEEASRCLSWVDGQSSR
jgi:hypothetical protein